MKNRYKKKKISQLSIVWFWFWMAASVLFGLMAGISWGIVMPIIAP